MIKADFHALALVTTILTLGAFFGFVGGQAVGGFAVGPGSAETDDRAKVTLTPELKASVLKSMRGDEEALQGIQSALAAHDYDTAAKLADQRGSEANPSAQHHAAMLPKDWQAAEHDMRRSYDDLAVQLRQNAPMDSVLAQNARIMSACVSCHQDRYIAQAHPS